MTTPEELFRTAMLANAGIAALLPGGRLYLVQLPQNATFPAATYQRISTQRNWVNAPGGQFSDMGWVRLQIDLWANTATGGSDVLTLAQAFRVALRTFNAYNGTANGGSNRILNERMHVEPNTQPPMYRVIMDVQIWFSDNT